MTKIIPRDQITAVCAARRAAGECIVFTNGCFDILHAGHVELLRAASKLGDFLVVGVNSDASVRRLKGPQRPVNSESARATVLAALEDVSAVCIFDEDTPEALIAQVKPHVHVKGGDYTSDDLPEARVVHENGGEIVIVPLKPGFSTTGTIQKLASGGTSAAGQPARSVVIIPARFASTRFPGKPLAELDGKPVIVHVVAAALRSGADPPVLVATDFDGIAAVVRAYYPNPKEVDVVMTGADCATGTDRIAQALTTRFGAELGKERLIVVNVQGDEPFIDPAHVDGLIEAMRADSSLQMATLATPLSKAATDDPNVVKVVRDQRDDALYFSRLPIPYEREAGTSPQRLRHLGVYAYEARWLLRMAKLPPTPLENSEKLEQLRALENGIKLRVVVVDDVVDIAIDTPEDLQRAKSYLSSGR